MRCQRMCSAVTALYGARQLRAHAASARVFLPLPLRRQCRARAAREVRAAKPDRRNVSKNRKAQNREVVRVG